MRKLITVTIIVITIFIAGMLTNHFWHRKVTSGLSKSESKNKVLYWVAPMNPGYRRNKPGKSPMGMDLVPVYASQGNGDKNVVKISPAVINNLGVKTSRVKLIDLSRVIDTVGYVTVDENNIEHIHTYTDGWIKVLSVKTTGELVKKDQLLLELYSPTLNNAQEELLLAIKNKNFSLIRAGEKKLQTLGMSKRQIDSLKLTRRMVNRVKVYATKGGIVSKLNVREGKFVKPDTDLMTIEDLSQIWMIAEVFERQAAWVKQGQMAIATLSYIPGKKWQGKVDYVYPELDQKTHTLRVRLTFPNPDLVMKPKMYANIKILSQTIKQAIAIPRAALIRTGEGDRVILAMGKGRFKARSVKVGIESGDFYQILSGLSKGDVVVTSAQFLIDSESNLKASLNRMQDDSHSQKKDKRDLLQEFVGMGKVKAINHERRTVTLFHQPIPLLNMPKMTMELLVDKKVNLKGVKKGDGVHFVLIKQSDGSYLVTKIHVTQTGVAVQPQRN